MRRVSGLSSVTSALLPSSFQRSDEDDKVSSSKSKKVIFIQERFFKSSTLHSAYSDSAREIASKLIDEGANFSLLNKSGDNILDRALADKSEKWLELLEAKGVVDKLFASDPSKYLKKLQALIKTDTSFVPWQRLYIKFLTHSSPTLEVCSFWCEKCLNTKAMTELVKCPKAFEALWFFLISNTDKFSEAVILNVLKSIKSHGKLADRLFGTQMLIALLKQDKTKAAKILIKEGVYGKADSKGETALQVSLAKKQKDIAELLWKDSKKNSVNPAKEYALAELADFGELSKDISLNSPISVQDKLCAFVDCLDIPGAMLHVLASVKSGAVLTPEIIAKLVSIAAKSRTVPAELFDLILDFRIKEGKLYEDLDDFLNEALRTHNPFSSRDTFAAKLVRLGAVAFYPVLTARSAFAFVLASKNDEVISKYIDNLVQRKQLARKDYQHRTPFLLAVEYGCELAIRQLLEAGTEVEDVFPDGNTILTFLIEHNQQHLLEIVCNAKTQQQKIYDLLRVKGREGKTPDVLASDTKRTALFDVLERVFERPMYQAKKVDRRKNAGKTEITLDKNSYITIEDKILGKGRTGEVFLCTKTSATGTIEVAGKKQILDFPFDGKAAQDYVAKKHLDVLSFRDLIKETNIHKRLIHASILRYYGCAFYNGKHAVKGIIVQELGSKNLRQVLSTDWGDQTYRLDMLKGVLEGLVYLHGKDIYHRDIKPENLVFVPDGKGKETLKIADFGVACLGTKHKLIGSPTYLAPDTLLSEKSDILSLGVVFYEMLYGYITNKPPCPTHDFFYQKGEPAKNTADHLVWQMTAPKPEDRPDAKEALVLLAQISP